MPGAGRGEAWGAGGGARPKHCLTNLWDNLCLVVFSSAPCCFFNKDAKLVGGPQRCFLLACKLDVKFVNLVRAAL